MFLFTSERANTGGGLSARGDTELNRSLGWWWGGRVTGESGGWLHIRSFPYYGQPGSSHLERGSGLSTAGREATCTITPSYPD